MPAQPSSDAPRALLWTFTLVPILLGSLVLLGWALDVEALRYLSPLADQPRIKANAAACIMAVGLALTLLIPRGVAHRRRRAAHSLAVLVCLVAGLTLAEHVLGIDVGIDQLLVQEHPGAARTPHPGRMAANTAIAIVLLALGVILARGDTAAVRLLAGRGAAGITTRRLMPTIVVVPMLLAFLSLEGRRHGLYGLELGTWLLAVSLTAVFAVVAWRLVRRLDAAERRSREAERQSLDALQAAERANAAKSEFISRMSHELRTPMNSILGFAQLMEIDGVADRHREHVGHVLRSGRHLLELINEILDISRIEAGRLTISPEPVHLATAVSECAAMMEPLAHERGIALEVTPEPAGTYVAADHQRLRQVLLNLLANAIKFNTPGGQVAVSWSEDHDTVRILVRDTGIGIPADRLPELFMPFERLGAENGPEEGTGLGLTLCQQLVRLMSGSIEVASEPGAGTTFTVSLAIASAAAAPPPAQPSTASARGALDQRDLHVVYIEDNLANLRLVEALLEPHRAIVRSARTAAEGARLVAQEHPDVVLLDLHLPDGSGFDVLRSLKARPDTATIPIILLTADATSDSRRRAFELGADDYLAKPLDVDLLLRALGRVDSSAGDAAITVAGRA